MDNADRRRAVERSTRSPQLDDVFGVTNAASSAYEWITINTFTRGGSPAGSVDS